MVAAIIPVREFQNTKLRIQMMLSKSERAALTKSLLEHVLIHIEKSQVSVVVIVASDKRSTSRIARRFSKVFVMRETRHHGGVSNAMEDGMEYCRSYFIPVTAFMLIPSDLPLVSSKVIDKAISRLNRYDLVISPSKRGDGTSLLLFNFPEGKIPFHYDDNSYEQHVKEAKKLNVKYSIFKVKEFSSDIDSISDLWRTIRNLHAKSLQDLVTKLSSSERI